MMPAVPEPAPSSRRPERIILLVALILRLAIAVLIVASTTLTPEGLSSRMINGDAVHYLTAAQNLAERGIFSLSTAPPYEPDILRTPGYPALLAVLYALAGGRHSPALIVLVQAALGVLSTWLVMWLGRQMFTWRVALIAGALYAVAPAAIIQTGIAITETLYGALLLGGLALTLLAAQPGRRGWLVALLGGLIFAAGTYTRPIGLYFILIPALVVIVQAAGRRWAVGRAIVIVAIYGLALLPWFARSVTLFGEPVFSSLGNQNLLMYNLSSVEAQRQGISWGEAQGQLWGEYTDRLHELGIRGPNQAQISRVMGALAREHILAHPVEAALYQSLDMLNVLRPGYSMATLIMRDENAQDFGVQVQEGNLGVIARSAPHELIVYGVMTVYYLLLYPMIAAGGVLLLARRRWAALLLLGGTAFYHLYLPGAAGNSRFRAPVEGVLALAAALGLAWVWARVGPRLRRA